MKVSIENDKPIYLQIKDYIEEMILREDLKEGDQIPSTTEMVKFYKINHLTVSKGMNMLVDEKIIFKKRGIGMFVENKARDVILNKRKKAFESQYVCPLIKEAKNLSIGENELISMILERYTEEEEGGCDEK